MSNTFFSHANPISEHSLAKGSVINNIAKGIEAGFDKLPLEGEMKEGRITYAGTDTGVADAYEVSLKYNPTAYTEGMSITFKVGCH